MDVQTCATPVANSSILCYTQRRRPVSSPKDQFRIKLTPEQKTHVREATGKDAEAVELSVEELEERIAPITLPLKPK
jgi:hypothetical protein